jgi:hypothetical protein
MTMSPSWEEEHRARRERAAAVRTEGVLRGEGVFDAASPKARQVAIALIRRLFAAENALLAWIERQAPGLVSEIPAERSAFHHEFYFAEGLVEGAAEGATGAIFEAEDEGEDVAPLDRHALARRATFFGLRRRGREPLRLLTTPQRHARSAPPARVP